MTYIERSELHAARIVLAALFAVMVFVPIARGITYCRWQIVSGTANAACQMSGFIDPWEYKVAFPEIFGD